MCLPEVYGNEGLVIAIAGPASRLKALMKIMVILSGVVATAGYVHGVAPAALAHHAPLISSFDVASSTQSPLMWERTFGGSGGDRGSSVAVDRLGNIYVAGVYNASTYCYDGYGCGGQILLLKYDPLGNGIWQRSWGQTGTEIWARGIVVDNVGNVYLSGYLRNLTSTITSFPDTGPFLLKFSPAGGILWQKAWAFHDSYGDYCASYNGGSVSADSSGYVYVAGDSGDSGNMCQASFSILRFSPEGNLVWTQSFSQNKSSVSFPTRIVVDSSDHLYVAGGALPVGNATLLKLDSTGNSLWQRSLQPHRCSRCYLAINDISVDPSGNLYVTGNEPVDGIQSVFLAKMDSTGNLLWRRTWTGARLNEGLGVAVAASGEVFVTGYTGFNSGHEQPMPGLISDGPLNMFLLRFSSQGDLLGQRTLASFNDIAGSGVVLDSRGNVLVTGFVANPPPYLLGASNNFTTATPALFVDSQILSITGPNAGPNLEIHGLNLTPSSPGGSETYAGDSDSILVAIDPSLLNLTAPTVELNVSLVDVGRSGTSPDSGTIRCGSHDYRNNEVILVQAGIDFQCDPGQAFEFHANTTAVFQIWGGIPGSPPAWPVNVHVGNGGYLSAFFSGSRLPFASFLRSIPPWLIAGAGLASIVSISILVTFLVRRKSRRIPLVAP